MFAEIDKCALFYEERGVGKPLVLIHGFGSDHKSWDGIFEALSAAHRVIRYDLRGFGASVDRSTEPFSHAADLKALLDHLKIERTDLLGVSMGGAVAVNFALRASERVERLVLVSPGSTGWEWTPAWRAFWSPVVRGARAGDMAEAKRLWWMHPFFEVTRTHPAAAQTLRDAIERYSGIHWVEGDRQERVTTPDLERLHLVAAPTLLFAGAKDMEDLHIIANAIAAMVPRVTRIDYPEAGHLLHLEEPKRFLADVLAFLDGPGYSQA
jgi:pimeloyl-ACP methyl ester carboxylesterase